MEPLIPLLVKSLPWLGGAVGGAVLTVLKGRRALLTYSVNHQRVGTTANDAVHGQVEVRYRGNVVHNLYLSTVEITNRSIRDLENLEIRTYRGPDQMMLLTERPFIEGSIHHVNHTAAYDQRLFADAEWEKQTRAAGAAEVPENVERLTRDAGFRHGQRHYLVPVLTRGQVINITYLSTVAHGVHPLIHVDCQSKGVRVVFQRGLRAVTHLWGVPVPTAAFVGLPLGVVIAASTEWFTTTPWVLSMACFIAGVSVAVQGMLVVKLYRWLRKLIVG
jgi:hypothetical protein